MKAQAGLEEVPLLTPQHEAWGEVFGPEVLVGAQRELGDLVRLPVRDYEWLLVSHPDDVAKVLRYSHQRFNKGAEWDGFRVLTGQGVIGLETPEWLARRRTLQPAFTMAFHARYAREMAAGTRRLCQRWQGRAQRGETVLVRREMAHLTLSNTGRTLFGCDIDDLVEPVSRELEFAVSYLSCWHNMAPWKRQWGVYFPHTRHARFRRALDELEEVVAQILARHAKGGAGDELLALIVGDDTMESPREKARRVRDEVITFLFTGNETTALAVSWCWYLLGQHPEWRERLHRELDEALGGRSPGESDLEGLPLTRAIVLESLRLYPPTWQILRQTGATETLSGHEIPPGTILDIAPYVVHRRAQDWPEPERFDPNRFSPGADKTRAPFSFVPFGGGPRLCLGMRTALLEAQLIIATIAGKFQLDPLDAPPISMLAGMTLAPSDGLPMRLSRRC